MSEYAPLQEKKRLEWIDAARGVALFGILMVNVPAFNAPFFLYGGEEVFFDETVNRTVQIIIEIFFQASFYTLFSFLFGFGMQMMKERFTQHTMNYRITITRRLLAMLTLGVLHAFLLWHGDILISYAIIGLLLFLFYNCRTKTLALWFLALLTIPTLYLLYFYYNARELLDGVDIKSINNAFIHYQSESITVVLKQNYIDWLYSNGGITYLYLVVILLPMFLAGMLFMKKKWLHHVNEHKGSLIKILFVSLFFFLVCKVGPVLIGNPTWLTPIQDYIGGPASAIFYVVAITLIYQYKPLSMILKPFTSVGRMSLTNYIGQSLICFLLFYGPGLGWYGKVSPVESVVIVLCIFSTQVVISYIWLKFFRFGPLEWIWRSVTYWKLQPFKQKGMKKVEEERA